MHLLEDHRAYVSGTQIGRTNSFKERNEFIEGRSWHDRNRIQPQDMCEQDGTAIQPVVEGVHGAPDRHLPSSLRQYLVRLDRALVG